MIQGLSYSYPADCWSFGVLVYELLNLERPFSGHTTSDLVKSILTDEPRSIANQYSEEIKQLTLALLIKEPSQRLGMAGMLTHPYYFSKVAAYPQSYRPKALEERLKRAHAKQLTSQVEGLRQSTKSSLMPLSECITVPNCILDPTKESSSSKSLPPLLLPILLTPRGNPTTSTSTPNSGTISDNTVIEDIILSARQDIILSARKDIILSARKDTVINARQISEDENKFPIL